MDLDKHQAALDGIRGFAAVSVVIFHVGRWLGAPLALNSGLAVDLFFMLSGYVIALAYKEKLDTAMTVKQFLVIRLVRLMPLVILGTLVSASYLVARIHIKHEDHSFTSVAIATLLGIVDLPYLTAPLFIGGNQIFPLNGPQYSLFLEIVINSVWAFVSWLRRGKQAALVSVICFSVIVMTGVLGGDTPETFFSGFPRVSASFVGGVALFNLDRSLPAWRGWPVVFRVCCLAMVTIFYIPVMLPFSGKLIWAMIFSPLLVISGAHTVLTKRYRIIAILGGRLSYPIYIMHYPVFIWMNGIYQVITHRQNIEIEGPMLVATVIIVSYAALRFYDEPIRRRLNGWLSHRSHEIDPALRTNPPLA